jgi:hypothetical protein
MPNLDAVEVPMLSRSPRYGCRLRRQIIPAKPHANLHTQSSQNSLVIGDVLDHFKRTDEMEKPLRRKCNAHLQPTYPDFAFSIIPLHQSR